MVQDLQKITICGYKLDNFFLLKLQWRYVLKKSKIHIKLSNSFLPESILFNFFFFFERGEEDSIPYILEFYSDFLICNIWVINRDPQF